jgi:integrase
MSNPNIMTEAYSQEDWLKDIFSNTESDRSVKVAEQSLKVFDIFCEKQGQTRHEMIGRYQNWLKPEKIDGERPEPDIRSICLSLSKFTQFMNEAHDDIEINVRKTNSRMKGDIPTFKKKSPRTIQLYFGYLKSYLRKCHDIKLDSQDIKDFVTFPKNRKPARQPLTLQQLKHIVDEASPKRRALYYVLISSGMRLGEGLSLTRRSFHFEKNPVKVDIEAEYTKTKVERSTYISSEAVEKLKLFLGDVFDHKSECDCIECSKLIFGWGDSQSVNVLYEDQYFHRLRARIGKKLSQKEANGKFVGEGFFKKYPNSVRFVVNIHSMRAYFISKASMKHGETFSHAMSGHGSYLKEYNRIEDMDLEKMYLELEDDLWIESVRSETDKINIEEVKSLKDSMKQLQDEVERLKKYPQTA